MTTEAEVVQHEAKRLADLERIAFRTGEYRGRSLDFSVDGVTWLPVIAGGRPEFARATVRRDGYEPFVAVIVWADAVPTIDDEWGSRWVAHPHPLFGAYATRKAFRMAFRDVMPDFAPDEHVPDAPDAPEASLVEPMAERDWYAAIALATDREELDEIFRCAQHQRVVDLPLDAAFKKRRREFEASVLRAEMREIDAQKTLGAAIDRLEQTTRPAHVTPADVARALGASMTKRGERHGR